MISTRKKLNYILYHITKNPTGHSNASYDFGRNVSKSEIPEKNL